MKLLHLSDLHFTADEQANAPLRQRFDFIRQRYPNHVFIITGDVVDNEGAVVPGTPIPIRGGDAVSIIPTFFNSPPPPFGSIQPHLDRTKLALRNAFVTLSQLPRGKVFLCAGNHDFGLWGNLYDEEYAKAFDDVLFTPLLNRGGPTDGGILTINSLLLDEPLPSSRKPMLYILSSGGVSVSLVGLCTAIDPANGTNPLALATGIVGGRQLDALRRIFPPALPAIPELSFGFGIVFMHHHPWVHAGTMKLIDSDELMSILRNKINLIMFGHRHVEKRYEPQQVQFGGLTAGALAAGSSREQMEAWEITIEPRLGMPPFTSTFLKVPII